MSWFVYLYVGTTMAILALHALMALGRTEGVVVATHLDSKD